MWSNEVKQRDGGRCVICGATEGLQAHHIKPIALYPECKNDIDNGITLCKACHQKQHNGSYYGAGALPFKGLNSDPDNRIKTHREKVIADQRARTESMKGLHIGWRSNKDNAPIIIEAARAAGQTPNEYIAEAIAQRLAADGYSL